MARFYKRNLTARKGRRTTRKVTVRPPRKTNAQKLQKQINYIKRKMSQKTTKHHLYQAITNVDPVVTPYNYYNLTQWNNVSSVFGTALVDWSNANKMIFNKLTVDVKVEQSLEADPITLCMALVSLKDSANTTSRFNASTGALALNSAIDYAQLNGSTFLNPRVFNIHRFKRFYFSNGGASLSTTGAGDRKLIQQWCRWNLYPKHTVSNAASNVRDMVCSQDPSKCYYLLVFNDNLLSDLTSPVVTVQCHYKVEFPQ